LVVVWDIERCTISSEYECASVIDSLRKQVDKNDDISDFKIKVFVRKEAPVSSALLEQLHGENATLIIVPSSKASTCKTHPPFFFFFFFFPFEAYKYL